ncbi:unnamed protein product [Paramecium octaurelia]|uniref:C2 domain-containing protein n=1 Tax=Paramecium octaurelia TaxID=43137 RepID=A0A8S1XI39_PAROT|nr:unnamed protein product [Paramecium octaurelia]
MQQIYNPDERINIELFLAARELPNLEFLSKSDPYLELYYSLQGEPEICLGKTETAECNLDPNWEKSFTIEYYPDLIQILRFQIFDQNRMGREFMGEAQITIKDILQSKNSLISIPIKRFDKSAGQLLCKAVQMKQSNHFVQWQFSGSNIKNMDGIFGKSDPFLKFYLHSDNVWCQIYQTEYIKDDLNPTWKEFEISLQRLCLNDEYKKFKIECLDRHEKGKNNQLIGSFETSIDEIFNQNKEEFSLVQPKGGQVGTIRIKNKKRIYRANFDDYIKQGTTFNLIIGIDYSTHNGVPSFPDSLHSYIDQNNKYGKVISDLAQVLEKYNQKKLFAIYGIGAEPHLTNYTLNTYQTLFPLTGDFQKPQVEGYQEVANLYKNTLKQIVVKGDFQIEDYIKYIQTIAENNAGKLIYTICVIIGQGKITDAQVFQDLLIKGCKLPYSLIFVGMGKNDFSEVKNIIDKMNNQQPPIRNNFTFYEYKEQTIQMLSKHLMIDIPQHLVSYKQ